ncbi:MAG: hypothetical protein J6X58_03610 [Bacteroidales bacterium]|nr:hypothetical protein [Bacteroidales bacterium]
MGNFFKKDSVVTGLVVSLGSEIVSAVLIVAGIYIAGESFCEHVRWMGGAFIAPVLLLRYYAKKQSFPTITKTIIVVLFLSFVVYMFFVLR